MTIPAELISAIERNAFRQPSPAVQVLIDEILARHGRAVQGILFYGSCLRSGDDLDGLVDLYLLVDSYRSAGSHMATWNTGNHSSGMYFYRFRSGDFTSAKKMLLVR